MSDGYGVECVRQEHLPDLAVFTLPAGIIRVQGDVLRGSEREDTKGVGSTLRRDAIGSCYSGAKDKVIEIFLVVDHAIGRAVRLDRRAALNGISMVVLALRLRP